MCLTSTTSLDESQGMCNIIIEIKNLKNQKIFYNFILNNKNDHDHAMIVLSSK